MVKFDDDTSVALFSAGILAIDENGRTVFTGLTATETRFVLDFEVPAPCENRDNSDAFAILLAKFHAARAEKLRDTEQLAHEQLRMFSCPSSTHLDGVATLRSRPLS